MLKGLQSQPCSEQLDLTSCVPPLCACFYALQERLLERHFTTRYDQVVTCERLVFGDFMVPGADPKVYAQVGGV